MDRFMNGVSNYRGTRPFLGKLLVGTSAVCAFMAIANFYGSSQAQNQINFRKSQLSQPIYKLSDQQMINPPWNQENIREWLYRRVEVSGRPVHRLTCMVPRTEFSTYGFQYVVPLLVKEEFDRSNPKGLILSKGWIPSQWKSPNSRFRLEDVSKQTFVGFVSQLQQLKSPFFFYTGNNTNPRELDYRYADVKDFVETSGFVNKKQAGVAVIERLYEDGPLDERNLQRRNNDAAFSVDYPYYKNYSGALQLPKMPWDYKNQAKNYLIGSVLTAIVGASVF